jgi:hypothetical protein
MKEAIASLDAAGDPLANDGAGAAEGGDIESCAVARAIIEKITHV